MHIEVYTDGSAQTKDKPGGWGVVILIDGILHKELAGHLERASNNDAELVAAIKGLDYVVEYFSSIPGSFPIEVDVTLVSDSQIVLGWASGSYRFRQVDKMFLYESLRRSFKKLNTKTRWVKGHSGDIWNSRCDKLANNARKGVTTKALDKASPIVHSGIGTKKSGVSCIWFKDKLKVIDFEANAIEDYNKDIHGIRGSFLEIREEKTV